MSLSSATNRVVYTGNGVASTFSITFDIFDDDHIAVYKETISDGTVVLLVKTTDYTLNANLDILTLVAGALSSLYRLLIVRSVPLTQLTDIRNQGTFLPETHEETFDYLTMIDQQQQRQIDRSVKVAEADYAFDTILPRINDAAGKLLQVNASSDGFDLIEETDISATPGPPEIFGSLGSPRSIVSATGIVAGSNHMSVDATNQVIFVKGSIAGENIISANPQISDGTVVGMLMYILGADNSNYITLNHGNNLVLNGPWSSNNNNSLTLMWQGSDWTELNRKQ